MKSQDKLFANVMQLKSGFEHLQEFICDTDSSFLKPFLLHFQKVCLAIDLELAQQTIVYNGDRHKAELDQKYDSRRIKRA